MRDSILAHPDKVEQSTALLSTDQQNHDTSELSSNSTRKQQIKIGLMLGAVSCTLFIAYTATLGGYSVSYLIVSLPILACSVSITAAFYFMLKESKYSHLALLAAGLLVAAFQS